MKITVVGIGYVGLSNAIVLSQKHEVIAIDVNKDKVDIINSNKCFVKDKKAIPFISENLHLKATTDEEFAYTNADYIVVCVPTNYDEAKRCIDITIVERVCGEIRRHNKDGAIVVKSTVPIGLTEQLEHRFGNVLFSPEFLREGTEVYDNLFPSRIIVGGNNKIKASEFANVLSSCCCDKSVKIIITNSSEAEAIKLFSNAYLAMRVSFFNELDMYAELKNLNTKDIIKGVCADRRIGDYYNNPSFGYGGYCFPKDTKQLLHEFNNIPNEIISGIVKSNETRINHIAENILENKPSVVGIYRLQMKKNSDNFRSSAIVKVIDKIKDAVSNKRIIIYEPLLDEKEYCGCKVINDLDEFKKLSGVIVANRYNNEIEDVKNKVYCRDLFFRD